MVFTPLTPASSSVGIGITLPIQKGKTGYFAQSFDILTQVKSNLIDLLLTRKGERPMQPTLGCDLHTLLWQNEDSDFNALAQKAVENAVAQWLPFLTVKTINVIRIQDTDTEGNRTDIQVTFSLKNNPNITDSIVLTF